MPTRTRFGWLPAIPIVSSAVSSVASAVGIAATVAAATDTLPSEIRELAKELHGWRICGQTKADGTKDCVAAGAIIAQALSNVAYANWANLIGPQLATLAFAIPGMAQGDDFGAAWSGEFGSRVKQLIQYFASKSGNEDFNKAIDSAGIKDSAAAQKILEAYPQVKAEYDKIKPQLEQAVRYIDAIYPVGEFANITPTQLAARLGIREDMAAFALAYWNKDKVPNAAHYSKETGAYDPLLAAASPSPSEAVKQFERHMAATRAMMGLEASQVAEARRLEAAAAAQAEVQAHWYLRANQRFCAACDKPMVNIGIGAAIFAFVTGALAFSWSQRR